MHHVLKPFHCPSCNSNFSSRDAARQYSVARYPLLIPCYHSACENCLRMAVKNNKTFICQVCKNPCDLSEGDISVSKFQPDVHALGIINANMKNALPSLKVKMVLSDSKRNESFIPCGNCNQKQALWQCDDCHQNYCNFCFDKVHKTLNTTKKHEGKKLFAESYSMMVQEGCTEHESKPIEFYCEADNQLTCSFCMLMGAHVGHEVKSLMDKNKSCADDLKKEVEEVTEIQKRLRYTEHLINEALPNQTLDVTHLIKEVHDHFHKLHTMLQLRESELLSELEVISHRHVEPLEKMRLEIAEYQREIVCLKKDAESVIENPCLAISAPALLMKLEECKALPCYFVPLETTSEESSVKLQINTDLEEHIKNLGQLEFNIKQRFCLRTANDLPETYPTDIPEKFNVPEVAADSVSSTVDDTFSEDSLSVQSSTSSTYAGIKATFKCRDFVKSQPEKVAVSFIKNPSKFWIQRCSNLRKLKALSDAIDKYCKFGDGRRSKLSEVSTGDLYLAHFNADGRWYRGIVKRKLHSDDYKVSPVANFSDGPLYEVYYIDYGNTEIVPLSKLKSMPTRFLNCAGMAKECCLVDIEPVDEKWSTEAIKLFSRFTSNKRLIMTTYEERNNVLYIDLSQVPDNEISNDVPVSIRDALVFLEYGKFSIAKKPSSKSMKGERRYLPPENLKVNANIPALVSHVNSPSHFFIQQMSTVPYLSSLIFEMNNVYSSDTNESLFSIFAPRVGMICAAQFSVDKQWYRAQVLSLPGGSNVEVQFVDFGNTEVVHYKYLRKILDKFCKLNIQAIPCKLADVTYNQERCWSNEAKAWLTKQVSKKQLTVKSLGMIPGENKAEVVLYYTENDVEVCVNALIVEAGLAASFGRLSITARKNKTPSPKKVPPPTTAEIHSSSGQSSSESIHDDVLEEMEQTSRKTENTEKKKFPTLKEVFPDSDNSHMEIHVSHVESPGLFYIRIAGSHENRLKELMAEMQLVYQNLAGSVSECNVGKAYAVYSEKQNKWFRGRVLSNEAGDIIKVFYLDYGITEDVNKKHFRSLVDKFISDEAFSICCHLKDIIPAGGSSQWSFAACDDFRQLVSEHEVLHIATKVCQIFVNVV